MRAILLSESYGFGFGEVGGTVRGELSAFECAVGVGDAMTITFSFALSFAAFAVACCNRFESAFNRSVSDVDCELTLVSCLAHFEQPSRAKRPIDRAISKSVFITECSYSGDETSSNKPIGSRFSKEKEIF